MSTAFVYDDKPSVPTELRPLIGAPKFGDIVFRRRSLFERIDDLLKPFQWSVLRLSSADRPDAIATELAQRGCTRVLHFSSELVPADESLALDRLERLAYADDACQGALDGSPAPLVALPFESYVGALPSLVRGSRLPSSVSVPVDGAFVDLSDMVALLDFLSGAFNSRHFNNVRRSRREVIKFSTDVAKVRAEHDFYQLLPERMRPWFVMPYELEETAEGASYTMERLLMLDMGQQWINGAVDLPFLEHFLEDAFRFLDDRVRRPCGVDKARSNFEDLYVDKVKRRMAEVGTELATYLDGMLRMGTGFESLARLGECYFDLARPYAAELPDFECVGHGDLCFSNMLYDQRIRLLKLIDPKGATSLEGAFTDPWYDYAKLSHSVLGGYDFIVNDLYEVAVDADLRLRLHTPDGDFEPFARSFVGALQARQLDVARIRLHEASLFLSMLPLHQDRPRDVLAFVLIAAHILEELQSQ